MALILESKEPRSYRASIFSGWPNRHGARFYGESPKPCT